MMYEQTVRASLFRRLSLSRKILLGIVPLFLVFISVSVSLNNYFQEQEMMEQAQVSARTYAEIIQESLVTMMVNNYEVDETFLERLNTLQQFDTLHLVVTDLKFRKDLRTESRIKRIETRRKQFHPDDSLELKVLQTGQPVYARYGDRFRAIIPFNATKACQKCHEVPVGYTLGASDLWISFARVSKSAQGNWRRSLIIFLAFIALAIAVATLIFSRYVSKPVDRLVDATKAISRGNLDYRIADQRYSGGERENGHSRSQDELVFLAARFDEMREALRDKIGQLDRLNLSLSERNIELEEALRKLKQAQEELVRSERLAVTGRMTAQLSHEINNPIHNIQSLLETSLRKVDGNAQAVELIGVALEEVTRMSKLTRQMLDFYRGSVVELEKEPLNIAELLGELVRTNYESLARQNVSLVLDTPTTLPMVSGSRDKLKQVFLNLIINAKDAMPDGGDIVLSASVAQRNVQVRVSDTGAGIPPENLDRIFDAFFTTKKEVSGVGLGLSVSYGIVQQHNGTITVQSNAGEGTTFTVQLPLIGDNNG